MEGIQRRHCRDGGVLTRSSKPGFGVDTESRNGERLTKLTESYAQPFENTRSPTKVIASKQREILELQGLSTGGGAV
jgi:hypothetical protein